MSIIIYSAGRMNLLKQTLLNSAEAGKPQDYEIRVDDMKVVPRTSDVEQFDTYEDFVTEETRKVVVLVYDGTSRRNTRHTFQFKEEKKSKAQEEKTLSGTDVEKILADKLEQKEKQWKYELLEKENKELKKQILEQEEESDKLVQYLEQLKGKRKLEDLHWGELIGIAGESILRRNTHLIAKVPGMQGLAGILERDTKEQEKQLSGPPQPQGEATYKMKEETKEAGVTVEKCKEPDETATPNKEDKQRLDFLRQLQERFSEEELRQVLTLLNMLVEKPQAIEPAILHVIKCNEQVKTKTEVDIQKKPQGRPQEKSEELQTSHSKDKKLRPETKIAGSSEQQDKGQNSGETNEEGNEEANEEKNTGQINPKDEETRQTENFPDEIPENM